MRREQCHSHFVVYPRHTNRKFLSNKFGVCNLQSQKAITALIGQQTNAIRNKDIGGATANYIEDMNFFDVVAL
jgi:hypothetical protein